MAATVYLCHIKALDNEKLIVVSNYTHEHYFKLMKQLTFTKFNNLYRKFTSCISSYCILKQSLIVLSKDRRGF